MKSKYLFICCFFFNLYNIEVATLETDLQGLKNDLYFCVTIEKKMDSGKVFISDAKLHYGIWTADIDSNTPILSPINTTISTSYTICSKPDVQGPAGTLKITNYLSGTSATDYNVFIWWDINLSQCNLYGVDVIYYVKNPELAQKINLDKYWVLVRV